MDLEQFLDRTVAEVNAVLAAVGETSRRLKKVRKAAQLGVIREIPKAIEAAQEAAENVRAEIAHGFSDPAAHLDNGWDRTAYIDELISKARQAGVDIHIQDDLLYCYPSLIRILGNEPTAVIDKVREKRLRPSVLVEHLKLLQEKPPRFKSDAFLESLHGAYEMAVKSHGQRRAGSIVPLAEIYDLLTLLPNQAREYSRYEFARDLCLLDNSGIETTRDHQRVHLHPARGNEAERRIFSTVAKDGKLLRYFGIAFD